MRIAVTGASGFVGQWLVAELEHAGHVVVQSATGRVDVRDPAAIRAWFSAGRPDAVAHLAAVAAPREVAADPPTARAIAVDGTRHIIDALATTSPAGIVLVVGSSEVYGQPRRLPLVESMPLSPLTAYALVKAEQELTAIECGRAGGMRIIATRSFNHTGPGQTTAFAIPAFAARIAEAKRTMARTFPVGNLDVRRDITDVRDVVVAYRLLLEHAAKNIERPSSLVVNVGSGRAVVLRDVVTTLVRHAGGGVEPATDPSLVHVGAAPEVRADTTLLRTITSWQPRIDLDQTLGDVMAAAVAAN